MKTLTIVADDRVGLLADISYILGKAKINIESISVDSVGGKAIILITVKDAKKAANILKKSGYKVNTSDLLVLKLEDKPGELSKITNNLAAEKINILNVHILSRDGKNTIIGMVVDKPRKAKKVLVDYLLGS